MDEKGPLETEIARILDAALDRAQAAIPADAGVSHGTDPFVVTATVTTDHIYAFFGQLIAGLRDGLLRIAREVDKKGL